MYFWIGIEPLRTSGQQRLSGTRTPSMTCLWPWVNTCPDTAEASPRWNSWKATALHWNWASCCLQAIGSRYDRPYSRFSPQRSLELLGIRDFGASFAGELGKKEEAEGLEPTLRCSSLERLACEGTCQDQTSEEEARLSGHDSVAVQHTLPLCRCFPRPHFPKRRHVNSCSACW